MKLMIKSKYSILQIIQLFLIFLMSLNFANLYFYIIFFAFFVCVAANFRRFKFDIVAICLILIAIFYILFFPPTRDSYTTILKQFSYAMCYLIGLNMFQENQNISEDNIFLDKQIKCAIMTVAAGTFLHYILNAVINIGSLVRNTVDFWTGDVVSATDQALLPTIALGVFSVYLVGEGSFVKKICSLLGLIAIFAYNFVLAGRTLLILEAILLFVAYLFIYKHMRVTARVKNTLFILVAIIVLLILFVNNAWGMREWIINSNLNNRFEQQGMIDDIRFSRKIDYVMNMFKFPFGGGELREAVGGYAHELYLDAFSDIGFFGYILIIAVVLAVMMSVVRLIKSEILMIETKALLLCVFLGINIVFFLEPILQGEPWIFCVFCFLSGVVNHNLFFKNHRKRDGRKIAIWA